MVAGIRSNIHVFVQFSAILFILVSGAIWPSNHFFLILEFLGIVLGIWSVFVMRKSVLSVMPDPDPSAILIKSGPYRIIRHPMYSALFLVLIPLVINHYTITRLIVLASFTVNQVFKIRYEEKLLKNKWPEYVDYMLKTWRIIPFLF
jgi:protein-S-isoprenylcysteine O-methyltransferase Ste14